MQAIETQARLRLIVATADSALARLAARERVAKRIVRFKPHLAAVRAQGRDGEIAAATLA